MPAIHVAADEVLTVSANPGGGGKIALEGTKLQWTVSAGTPLMLGPGIYHTAGDVICAKNGQVVAALEETLPRATEIVKSARIVATAIMEGRPVSALESKFKRLAERVKAVPKALEDRIDPLFPRLDSAEAKGAVAATGLETHVSGLEAGVAAIEDVVNQITNGVPAGDLPN